MGGVTFKINLILMIYCEDAVTKKIYIPVSLKLKTITTIVIISSRDFQQYKFYFNLNLGLKVCPFKVHPINPCDVNKALPCGTRLRPMWICHDTYGPARYPHGHHIKLLCFLPTDLSLVRPTKTTLSLTPLPFFLVSIMCLLICLN